MIPMPPSTCLKGKRRAARESTFDPMRGAFIVLSRPNDPEQAPMERRGGLGSVGHPKDPELLKEVMVRG
ncbi:unnamed protein product [Laminaria digitata]